MKQKHPWHHAATYIRAAFVEEIHPVVVETAERAALLLDRAANDDHPMTPHGVDWDDDDSDD